MTRTSSPAFGASGAAPARELRLGAIPEQVGQRAENSGIMAKRDVGITSRISRRFRGWSGS